LFLTTIAPFLSEKIKIFYVFLEKISNFATQIRNWSVMSITKDELVKELIVLKAQELFRQYGLKKTTMEDIAKASGKAKSTLYHYFKSKEEVFDSVVHLEMINLRLTVKKKTELETTLQDKIKAYVLEFYTEIINKVNLYRILKDQLVYQKISTESFNKIVQYEKDFVTKMFMDGIDNKELTGVPKGDMEVFAELFLASISGIVQYAIEGEGDIDIKKLKIVTDILVPRMIH